MKAYSPDLRERVAAACVEPWAKIYQVAARFCAFLSFTDKLLRRQRTSGSVAELPRHPGPAPRLKAAGDQRLLACLRAHPDATLAEIGRALVAADGPSLQRTAVWQAVKRLGWKRKKAFTPLNATQSAWARCAACLSKLCRKKTLPVSSPSTRRALT